MFAWDQSGIRIVRIMQTCKHSFGSYSHSRILGFHPCHSAPKSRIARIYSKNIFLFLINNECALRKSEKGLFSVPLPAINFYKFKNAEDNSILISLI